MSFFYESDAFARVYGGSLHPGGLDLTREILRFCKIKEMSVLDVGCGRAQSAHLLQSAFACRYTGVEPSDALFSQAQKQGVEVLQAGAEALPFADESFEALLCECVFSLVADRTVAMRECFRVLKHGGILALADVYARGRAVVRSANSCIYTAMTVEQIQFLISSAGFCDLRYADYTGVLQRTKEDFIRVLGTEEALFSCASACSSKSPNIGYGCWCAVKR